MKHLFLALLFLAVCFTSCTPGKSNKKVIKTDLFGKTVGNTHTNPFFNIKIEVPPPWQMETNHKIQTTFGSNMIDAKWYAEDDTAMTYPLITYVVESRKVNPFDRQESEIKELNDTYEGLLYLYDKNDVIKEPLKKIMIGGKQFLHSRLIMLDRVEDDRSYTETSEINPSQLVDTSFMDEYLTMENGYFLSILYGYESSTFQPIIQKTLKSITRLK